MDQKKLGIVLTYLTMAINIVVGIFYSPFLLEKVGDSQYGVYSLSTSLISFIAILDLGFGDTLVRYISKARSNNDKKQEYQLNGFFLKTYTIIAGIALILGVCVLNIYPLVSKKSLTVEEVELFKKVFAILLINLVFSFPMSIFSSTINTYERFAFLKATQLIVNVLKYICMTLALFLGYKVLTITIITTIAAMSVSITYLVYCRKKLDIKFSFKKLDPEFSKEIFEFSFFIFLNLVIDFVYNNSDNLVLGTVAGTTAVTVYTFGVYFKEYFRELSTAISGVFFPSIVSTYEKSKDINALSDVFNRVGRLQMALLSLALGGFALFGSDFINLWIGKQYSQAYYIGLIVMVPSIIPLTQNIGISILRAMNLHKYRSYMYLAIAVIHIIISIPLAKAYGGIGVAISTLIANLLGQILFMSWFYSKRIGLNIKLYYKNLLKFVLLTGTLVLVGFIIKLFININSWLIFIICAIIFSIVYGVCYWMFIADRFEKNLLLDTIKKFKR